MGKGPEFCGPKRHHEDQRSRFRSSDEIRSKQKQSTVPCVYLSFLAKLSEDVQRAGLLRQMQDLLITELGEKSSILLPAVRNFSALSGSGLLRCGGRGNWTYPLYR